MEASRDYSTISPTAKSLLLLKGITPIPFVKEAAQLMLAPQPYQPDLDNKDISFWGRVLHFEDRYWSIDQLLADLPIKNILELSSGFSFRGLEAVKQPGYHYIDTDLPEVVAIKKEFVAALSGNHVVSALELLPLNALDEAQFEERVSRFPAGEIVIVNEGLLMYLDDAEKEKLCHIIHRVLTQRGGYWITADIYVQWDHSRMGVDRGEEWNAFYAQHRIHENMFERFEVAEAFFKKMGFEIDKEAVRDRTRLTALPHLLDKLTETQLQQMRGTGRMRATWRLKVAE
jgi:O-methyltransferase involved in polyketide biosynthesis